jgi:hypothetical protein
VESGSLDDPWTAAYLGMGWKVYAGRAGVEGKQVLEGPYRAYAPGGVLTVEGTFKNGLPDGEFRYWYESGSPSGWCTYQRGREIGTSLTLHENGFPQRLCHRDVDGGRHGPEAYWDQAGRLEATLRWERRQVRQLILYDEGVPTETLGGEDAERRALQMMREAVPKL